MTYPYPFPEALAHSLTRLPSFPESKEGTSLILTTIKLRRKKGKIFKLRTRMSRFVVVVRSLRNGLEMRQ